LAAGLRGLAAFSVDETIIDTNIIFASLSGAERGFDSDKVKALLKEKGVLVSAWAPQLIRLVVHRDIDDDGIARAIAALKEVSMLLCG
jgi:threonine aldolase